MQISNRLRSLCEYVNKDDKIIDIGCDHALLDIYLVKNNYIDKMIVSDIHASALKAGIDNIKKHKLNDKIDTRLGNGLEVLNNKDKIDTLLISGMGSNTILKIFDNNYFKNINKLIIQSNNDHTLLRNEIVKLGFKIINETYFVDNKKNYINEVFIRGNENYTLDQLKYGPFLLNDPVYIQFELNNIERIKELIPNQKLRYKIKLFKEERLLKKYLKQATKRG